MTPPLGVSIVICCHNSAQRLPQALSHLAEQRDTDDLPWEVIVVDNASTDNTAKIAQECWPENSPFPLSIVHEPQLGLSYARQRGFAEAEYEAVSFVDDDNWVWPEWVQVVAEVMARHPDVGACGGFSEAVCEINPPWWFERYQGSYAVGAQGNEGGDVTWTRGFLWGAGLTIRKSAWQQLVNNRFRPLCIDRQGSKLTAGGDSELCFALRLSGWRLWYEPSMRLRHAIPAHRLNWNYLRRIHRGFGASTVGHDPYYFALQDSPKSRKERFKQTWKWQVFTTIKGLFRERYKLFPSVRSSLEGDAGVLRIEDQIGRLCELLQRRRMYDQSIQRVRETLTRGIS